MGKHTEMVKYYLVELIPQVLYILGAKIWHEGNLTRQIIIQRQTPDIGFAQVHWNNIINRPYLSVLGTERTLSVTSEGWYTIATCSTGRAYGEFHVL
jgi:hypothetical protein